MKKLELKKRNFICTICYNRICKENLILLIKIPYFILCAYQVNYLYFPHLIIIIINSKKNCIKYLLK